MNVALWELTSKDPCGKKVLLIILDSFDDWFQINYKIQTGNEYFNYTGQP